MKTEDVIHLQWIYNRLKDAHKENPNIDYMRKFKEIILNTQYDRELPQPINEYKINLGVTGSLLSTVLLSAYLSGIVFASGFWGTLFSIITPYGIYLTTEKILQMTGVI